MTPTNLPTPSADKATLRKELGEILVKWHMPTRQVAIGEIMQLFDRYCEVAVREARADAVNIVLDRVERNLPSQYKGTNPGEPSWGNDTWQGYNQAIEDVTKALQQIRQQQTSKQEPQS